MRQPHFAKRERVIHGKNVDRTVFTTFEDSRPLRGTERIENSKEIAEPVKITFLIEPNLIVNISLLSSPFFLFVFLLKRITFFSLFLTADKFFRLCQCAIRLTELRRCIFIGKEKKKWSELFPTVALKRTEFRA